MKYIVLIYNDPSAMADAGEAHTDELMRHCLANADTLRDEGRLLQSQMLEGPETARTIRVRNGRRTTVDGPFAETKEMLGGFNLIEARDMDEAVAIASTFPWASLGSIEIRPVRDMDAVRRRVYATTTDKAHVSAGSP
jgi:hypothetical protein